MQKQTKDHAAQKNSTGKSVYNGEPSPEFSITGAIGSF